MKFELRESEKIGIVALMEGISFNYGQSLMDCGYQLV